VVVTTRPSRFGELVSPALIQQPFSYVKVEGFTAEDVKEYVNRFYFEDHDKAEELIIKIKSSHVLSDLAKSPMLLLLMNLLWRSNGTLPDTMTGLYREAVRYIFKRKAEYMSHDEISK
ncbi:hypothetical protein, partial [Salmonella sp. s51090]|uniref:hypothetical protein n=1 Tax=Salmonella sp. s51090 TaxID=3159651 RepID=UPI00397F28D3